MSLKCFNSSRHCNFEFDLGFDLVELTTRTTVYTQFLVHDLQFDLMKNVADIHNC